MDAYARYRQDISALDKHLDKLAAGHAQKGKRGIVDQAGLISRAIPFKSEEQRMRQYAEMRYQSVARVLALFEIVREHESLGKRWFEIKVKGTGAVWQAFQGTTDVPACHTCPCHVQLDGQYPTQITRSRALQRRIIVELAHCVLMPKVINEVDKRIDHVLDGSGIFVKAVSKILNTKAAPWHEVFSGYMAQMQRLLAPARTVITHGAAGTQFPPDEQMRIDMVCALYEAIASTLRNPKPVHEFITEVRAEARIA